MKPQKIKGWNGVKSPVDPSALRRGLAQAGKKAHKIKNPL